MPATFEPSQLDRERHSLLPRKQRSALGDESCQVVCWVIASLPYSRRRQPHTLWARMPLNRTASVRCGRYQRRSSRQQQLQESNGAGRLGEREADLQPQADGGLQPAPVGVPQLGRALPPRCHALRQRSRQLPRQYQARIPARLSANFMSPRPSPAAESAQEPARRQRGGICQAQARPMDGPERGRDRRLPAEEADQHRLCRFSQRPPTSGMPQRLVVPVACRWA